MKNWLFIFVLFCSNIYAQEMTKIVAHRGAWKEFDLPQNSIASLNKAIEINAHGTEFDVHRTKDDVLIVFHDSSIDRKNIEDLTYDELKKYPLKNGEYIPVLHDFLTKGFKQNKTQLVLEIKSSPTSVANTKRTVDLVYEELKKHQFKPDLLQIIMFSWEGAVYAKTKFPNIVIQYLEGDKTIEEVKQSGLDGIDYHYSVLLKNKKWLALAKQDKIITNSWTINDWSIAKELIDYSLEIITTDYPLLFLEKVNN